jgi:prevent-host-death family protein
MKLSTQIKPISHLKANAAKIMERSAEDRQLIVVTRHGKAKAVIQDIASYEQAQETLALLKIIALGQAQIARGEVSPARRTITQIRADLRSKARSAKTGTRS